MTPTHTPHWRGGPRHAAAATTALCALIMVALWLPGTAAAASPLQPRLVVGFAKGETAAGQAAALRSAGVPASARQVAREGVPRLTAAVVEVSGERLPAVRAELLRRADVRYVEIDHVAHVAWTPGDLQLSEQWALPKLGAFQAWDTARGSGVTIAVVDTGVDYIHPELAGRVDLGWDYVDNDADPMDEQGHGTHVAGIAAAAADNSAGIAGLAPGARILAMRALDQEGGGYYSWIADAITRSADRGAKVINLSLGGAEGSQLLEHAVNYAAARGAIVACASGNESSPTIGYPARYDSCLAVGATNPSDARATFSNHGPGLDVTAPGTDILSTVKGALYEPMSGTSMATPYASGLAALLFSQGLGRQQVETTMRTTARDLGAPGYDTVYGHGRIDAAAAVGHAAGVAPAAPDTVAPSVTSLELGAAVQTGPRKYRRVWRKRKATRWKRVGVTQYRGRYSWKRTRRKGSRKVVTQYRMRGGKVYSRRIVYRRVRVVAANARRSQLPVTVTAADNVGLDRVALQVDGRWLGVDSDGADGWQLRIPCSSGQHTFVAHAYDAANNGSSLSRTLRVSC